MKDYENYYDYVKALCMIRNMRPSAACEKAGVSKSVVTKWKHGAALTMQQAEKLAPVLNVSIEELAACSQEALDWILAIPDDLETRAIAKLLWPDEPHALAADFVNDIRKYAKFLMLQSE